jgi:hypothetical protein
MPSGRPEAIMTAADQAKIIEHVTASLREITSLRDFVAAVEVGSKVAGEMLNSVEQKLLDCMDSVGDEP